MTLLRFDNAKSLQHSSKHSDVHIAGAGFRETIIKDGVNHNSLVLIKNLLENHSASKLCEFIEGLVGTENNGTSSN